MGTHDYYERSSQRRDGPVKKHSTRAEETREKIEGQRQVGVTFRPGY